jgi:excisionase family DNA binding protein
MNAAAGGGQKPYLTVKEAADFGRLALSTVRLYIRQRKIKAQKVGRRVIIAREELEAFLSRNPIEVRSQ